MNISRKNITDGDYVAEEDQRSGEPPPHATLLETFIDSPPARAYSGRNPQSSPTTQWCFGHQEGFQLGDLCGAQERPEGSGDTGQPVRVASLLARGGRHGPDLITVFSITLQH